MKEELNFDAIVIGAGYSGCSTAYYLAKAGMDVAIIDMRAVCSGASGRNGGQVIQLEGREELTKEKIIKRNMITSENKKLLEGLPEELGYDVEFLKIGSLDVAYSEEEAETIKRIMKIQHDTGDDEVEFLTREEMDEISPIFGNNFHGAKIRRSDGSINPFKMAHSYIYAGMKKGLKVYTYSKVENLIIKNGKVTGIKTKNNTFIAKYAVINATNAWSRYLIDEYPIMPCKILGFVTEQLPVIPVLSIEALPLGIGIYGSSQKDGSILIGGAPYTNPKNMDEHLSEKVFYEDFIQYGELFEYSWPAIKKVSFIRSWAGAVGFTPDSYPLVGPTKYDNLYIIAGFTNGNSWCPICGRLLSEYILNEGKTSINIDFLDPERFKEKKFDWPKSYNYTVLHNYIAETMK